MRKRITALALAGVMAAMLLAGCNTNPDPTSTPDDKNDTPPVDNTQQNGQNSTAQNKIVFAQYDAPSGVFNPLIADTRLDSQVNDLMYSSMMEIAPGDVLEKSLAEDYTVSDDQLTITYTMKQNVKWHDGQPLTAEDYVFTLECIANKDFSGSGYTNVEKIVGAKEFHEGTADTISGITMDGNKVSIQFSEVFATAATNLSTQSILPKHIWGKIPLADWDNSTEQLHNPIGSGPYKMAKFEQGQYTELAAYEEYFQGAPKTPKFIFKVVNTDSTQAELKNHGVDIADVKDMKQADIDILMKEGYKIETFPDLAFQYMGFNLRLPALQDKRVRQAFLYAVDRKTMTDKLLEGRGQMVNDPMLPSSWGYPDESTLNQYDQDVDKARSLLKEAGWEDKNGDGIVENAAGETLSLTIKCPTNQKLKEQQALIIQESMKNVGVAIDIDMMDFSTLMEDVVTNHEFELYMMNNTLRSDPDPEPFWHSHAISNEKGTQGYNIVAYSNPKVDELIEKGEATLDQAQRKAYYNEIGVILNEDVPQMYLFVQNNELMYHEKLQGFNPSTFNFFNNVHNWVIE